MCHVIGSTKRETKTALPSFQGFNTPYFVTMIGFGGNSCSELSEMDMMNMETNRKFLSLPLTNNSGAQMRTDRRLPVATNSIPQDHHYTHHNPTDTCSVRDKIMAHPLFPRLLSSYLNCLKVMDSKLFLLATIFTQLHTSFPFFPTQVVHIYGYDHALFNGFYEDPNLLLWFFISRFFFLFSCVACFDGMSGVLTGWSTS